MCIRVPRCGIKCKVVAAQPSSGEQDCVPNLRYVVSVLSPDSGAYGAILTVIVFKMSIIYGHIQVGHQNLD